MTKEADINSVYDNPNNLVDLFEQSVARWPGNRLFGTKNPASGQYEWVTYQQVAERINNLRGALKKSGLSQGDKVGVILNNCTEWYICEQAVHGLGGVFGIAEALQVAAIDGLGAAADVDEVGAVAHLGHDAAAQSRIERRRDLLRREPKPSRFVL